jgi:hypothetical protein
MFTLQQKHPAMNRSSRMSAVVLLLAVFGLTAGVVTAAEPPLISADKITSLQTQLDEALQSKSAARQKLALRRVIRACDEVLESNKKATNRFEMFCVLFIIEQRLIAV